MFEIKFPICLSMLVINTYSDMYVHVDLGLWILPPDLSQPSQINDPVKKVKAFLNGPNCEIGQCTMGRGTDGPLRISTSNAIEVLSADKDNHVDV
jgi:hypothetical protein